MMGQKSFVFSLILMVSVIPAIGLGWTSPWTPCEQQGLEGEWNVDVWAGDTSGSQSWDKCTLTVDSAGFVQAGGTYTNCLGESTEITGGQLIISAGCVIEGTIETSEGTVSVERGGIAEQGHLVLGRPE